MVEQAFTLRVPDIRAAGTVAMWAQQLGIQVFVVSGLVRFTSQRDRSRVVAHGRTCAETVRRYSPEFHARWEGILK